MSGLQVITISHKQTQKVLWKTCGGPGLSWSNLWEKCRLKEDNSSSYKVGYAQNNRCSGVCFGFFTWFSVCHVAHYYLHHGVYAVKFVCVSGMTQRVVNRLC